MMYDTKMTWQFITGSVHQARHVPAGELIVDYVGSYKTICTSYENLHENQTRVSFKPVRQNGLKFYHTILLEAP